MMHFDATSPVWEGQKSARPPLSNKYVQSVQEAKTSLLTPEALENDQLEEEQPSRWCCLKFVEQGLREDNEKRQSAKDRERSLPAARYPMFVQNLQDMSSRCSHKLSAQE